MALDVPEDALVEPMLRAEKALQLLHGVLARECLEVKERHDLIVPARVDDFRLEFTVVLEAW